MEYKLEITKNGSPILVCTLSAEEVIDMLSRRTLSAVEISGSAATPIPVIREKRKYAKRTAKAAAKNEDKKKRRFKGHACCGATGARHLKTCPQNGKPRHEQSLETMTPGGGGKTDRIRQLLKDGHNDEFISIETGAQIRSVKFIRDQMKSRGDL